MNENPYYKCYICGHRTTTDTLLEVHKKMHFARVHECNICKKTFVSVTELYSHILSHAEDKSNFQCEDCGRQCFSEEELHSHCHVHMKEEPLKNLTEDTVVKVSAQREPESKKFKNNPNLPMNQEEKLLLLHYVDELGLNKKYEQLEQTENYIKTSWMKIVGLFADNDYDRNSEQLVRTYFHLKNQAKIHIERFYKHKMLPEPYEIDYMFVKLCSNDFNIPGIDVQQILEDSKKIIKERCLESKDNCIYISSEEEEEHDYNETDPISERQVSIPEESSVADSSQLSSSFQKRPSTQDGGPLRKLSRYEDDDSESSDFTRIKLKSLLTEEERKNYLYRIQLKEKEELFRMEKRHRETIYKKELEIKNLEVALLKQKIENNRQF